MNCDRVVGKSILPKFAIHLKKYIFTKKVYKLLDSMKNFSLEAKYKFLP